MTAQDDHVECARLLTHAGANVDDITVVSWPDEAVCNLPFAHVRKVERAHAGFFVKRLGRCPSDSRLPRGRSTSGNFPPFVFRGRREEEEGGEGRGLERALTCQMAGCHVAHIFGLVRPS